MKIIKPCVSFEQGIWYRGALKSVCNAASTCYKSAPKETYAEQAAFVKSLIERGHESVLEHVAVSVRIICDRGVSHELVRHRIASFSQESTRYVNYKGQMEFIKPCFWEEGSDDYILWRMACDEAENNYTMLLSNPEVTPQQARSVLPNSLKTELVMTANLREWRHFLRLRTDKAAHPQMREVAVMIGSALFTRYPVFFEDIYPLGPKTETIDFSDEDSEDA